MISNLTDTSDIKINPNKTLEIKIFNIYKNTIYKRILTDEDFSMVKSTKEFFKLVQKFLNKEKNYKLSINDIDSDV